MNNSNNAQATSKSGISNPNDMLEQCSSCITSLSNSVIRDDVLPIKDWITPSLIQANEMQQLRRLTYELVRLFGECQLNFGNKAKKADYPIQKAVLCTKVIIHMQPTAKQWQQAKQRSILEEWPPSSARDLLALGDTNGKSYPNSRQAYIDAAQRKYVHAVVYETARRVGFSDMRSKAEAITYPCW